MIDRIAVGGGPGGRSVGLVEAVLEDRGDRSVGGGADVDAALARNGDRKSNEHLRAGTLIRLTARVDNAGNLHPLRIERAENEQRRDKVGEASGEASRDDDTSESRDDDSDARDDSTIRQDSDDVSKDDDRTSSSDDD